MTTRSPEAGSVTLGRDGRWFELHADLWLPQPPDEVFPFFASADNLAAITPPWLHFRNVQVPAAMAEGEEFEHRIRPRGLPMRWRSRITVWDPPRRFADEQLKGPYLAWIHEHVFEPEDGGTRCLDHVRYRVPGGRLVNRLMVAPDLRRIFDFRQARILELIGGLQNPDTAASG